VRGRFEANIRLSDLVEGESLGLSGEMLGPLGSSSGTGTVKLAAKDGGTAVGYRYDVHVAGKVAAVGGRMLDGAARILVGQFFEALICQAGGGQGAPTEGWWRRLLRAIGLAP
jgi:2-furoyl-CoA dehydrogenase large subunit